MGNGTMNLNTTLAIVLLALAIMESVAVKFILPSVFGKRQSSPEQKANQELILAYMNIGTYVLLLAGITVYIVQPLD